MIVFEDDPNLPCSYCVGWVEPDPFDLSTAYAIHPDGSRVERLYSYVHDECEKAVMDYVDESRGY